MGDIPRKQVFDLLSEMAAVVFTGLREEGGLALAETMLDGVPMIVLANGGARTLASSATCPKRVVLIQPSTVKETAKRFAAAMNEFCKKPSTSSGPTLDQDAVREQLRQFLLRRYRRLVKEVLN